MPRSRVAALSWIVALAFLLATALRVVDSLNLVATPPNLEGANLIDSLNGSAAYRQAIWPVFLWTNLLFAIGFAASVAFSAVVSAARGGMPTFLAIAIVGGVIGAIAAVMPIGSVEASVWQRYCDCGFKEQEMVSQFWAQGVTEDIADWLSRFASIVLAVGLVILVRDAGRAISSSLRIWTWLTAAALVAAPLMLIVEFLGQPDLPEWVSLITGAVLVPVWAVWLGRSVEAGGSPTAA